MENRLFKGRCYIMYLYEEDRKKPELEKNDEDLENLLKACDAMNEPQRVDVEPEVKTEINAIVDNETKEKDYEEKAKELLEVSIPLLHNKSKEGFLGIPANMLEILLKAGLTSTELKLFLYILKQTHGMNGAKKKYFEPKEKRWIKLGKDTNRLYLDQMADAIAISYRIIHRYVKKLKDKNMIIVLDKIGKASVIRVNLNWNQWNIDKRLRINQLVKILKSGKLTAT